MPAGGAGAVPGDRRDVNVDAEPRIVSGRYELGPVIGRGGMGEVRRARDQRLGRDVAIKFLRPDLAVHAAVRARFEHEARAAAGLSHPNVVTVFDTDEDNGEPYIVMECLPGPTLADELAQGPIAVDRVRRLASEALGALGAAHRLGILHRDIKPSNLLVCDDGTFKVADFGIAKTAEAIDHTTTGEILGTAAYLAPERLEGRPATPQSDLYSLGVVLYETLAGSKPFAADTPVGVAYKVRSTAPAPLRAVRPDADTALVTMVEQAMAKDPDDRYGSAEEMAAALDTPSVDSRAPTTTMPRVERAGDETAALSPATDVLTVAPSLPAKPSDVRRAPAPNKRLIGIIAAVAGVIGVAFLVSSSSGGSTGTVPSTVPTTATSVLAAAPPTTSGPPLPAALNDAIDKLDQAVQS